jgi:hypothetical protein
MKPTEQDTITDKEFDNLLETELMLINETVSKDSLKSYMPIMRAITKKDFHQPLQEIVIGFGDMPSDAQERFKLMMGLGAKLWDERKTTGAVVALVFTSEAWIKKMTKNEWKEWAKTEKRVADEAEKEEAIVTYCLTIDGRRAMAVHSINRDKDSTITGVDLKYYAPYRDSANQPIESDLLNNFFKGMTLAAFKAPKKGTENGRKDNEK